MKFTITEEEKRSIRSMYLLEQVTTSGQSVNQMVVGPMSFYRSENDVREYYIYKQGKTEQEAKFYVYYQDNPTNPKQPDKLTLLDKLSHDTEDLASKHVQEEIAREKREQQGGLEY